MRVRLVNPFRVEIARVDTTRTANLAGYDKVFNEPKTTIVAGKRQVATKYKDPIRVRCQIEDSVWTSLRMFDSGNSPESKIAFVIDRHELEEADLVNAETGEPLLNVNDKLNGIYTDDGDLVHSVRAPGLFCVETRWMSYGIGEKLNLLLLRYNDRALGAMV